LSLCHGARPEQMPRKMWPDIAPRSPSSNMEPTLNNIF
jgi:hypothetical protein